MGLEVVDSVYRFEIINTTKCFFFFGVVTPA
jgi:hypothetical protein